MSSTAPPSTSRARRATGCCSSGSRRRMPSPGWATASPSIAACRSCSPRPGRPRCRCCCSTSTGSRSSTTASVTRSATACSPRSRGASRPWCPTGASRARMGGDEFVVVPPPGSTGCTRRRLAQSLVDTLRAPVRLPDVERGPRLPASLGMTSTRRPRTSARTSCSARPTSPCTGPRTPAGTATWSTTTRCGRGPAPRHNAELLLRSALEQDRLTLQYQPIVDFENGRIVGAEALVRVLDPTGDRLLPPDDLHRRRRGHRPRRRARPLGHRRRGRAGRALACSGARRRSMIPWVAVNVSARSMEHPRVVRRLLDGMAEYRIAPDQLKVELTERSFLGTLPDGRVDAAPAARLRRPRRHRRLRHRLLRDGLPQPLRPRLHEDRPVLRRRGRPGGAARTPSSPRSSTSPTRTACR